MDREKLLSDLATSYAYDFLNFYENKDFPPEGIYLKSSDENFILEIKDRMKKYFKDNVDHAETIFFVDSPEGAYVLDIDEGAKNLEETIGCFYQNSRQRV